MNRSADIDTDPDDASIVRAIVSMADQPRLKMVAEGVENADQPEFPRRVGCTRGQGYRYAPPLGSRQILHYLKTGDRSLYGVK